VLGGKLLELTDRFGKGPPEGTTAESTVNGGDGNVIGETGIVVNFSSVGLTACCTEGTAIGMVCGAVDGSIDL
jgi:hypothetical protein